MALTWANVDIIYRGPRTLKIADATFDTSYAAGGETVTFADLGFAQIDGMIPMDTAGYNVTYDKTSPTAGKLAIYASSTPSTNSATSAPLDSAVGRAYSNVTVTVLIVGR